MTPTVAPEDSVPLETVVVTARLGGRPSRARDDRSTADALATLATALANSPRDILTKLCELAQVICQAGSAGVSLLSDKDAGKSFYWPAITGAWKDHVGGGTPRNSSPSGIVLDRGSTQMFARPERYYPDIRGIVPGIEQALLAPLAVQGKIVGTVWVLNHDAAREFDAEDQRQLESLAAFAAVAYQVLKPMDALGDRGPTPDSDETPRPARLKVLIVDDSRDAATSLAEVLEASGHEVHTAFDGYKALKLASTHRPDVMLVDVGMPGITGHEVAERIRNLPWGDDVMLIAVTGWGHEQDKRRAEESGFDHHLEKPADLGELERLLASAAARHRSSSS